MNLVGPGPASLAGFCLFFLPGLALLALLRREDRETLTLAESGFLMVGTSVMASSLVALVLAEAGRFSLVLGAEVLALTSVGLVLLLRRRLAWPFPRGSASSLLPVAAVLALALLFQARPGEYLMGGRDP